MAVIKLSKLGGLYPSVSARNLVEDGAQVSQNLLARSSEFRPLATDLTVATSGVAGATTWPTNPKSIYRHARKADGTLNSDLTAGWKGHASVLNLAKAQLNDSKTDRLGYSYADGSQRPRVFDATGQDRIMGIPAPTAAPTVTPNKVYTFTPQLKATEKAAAIAQAVELVKTNAAPALVGAASMLPATGWLMESDYSTAPDAVKNVIRIFALDPSTKAVIATYSAMSAADASWIFDPALGGYYSGAPGGFTLPTWATGHSLWWVIKMRGYARAYDTTISTLATALQTIKMPGTQILHGASGFTPYLTSNDATQVATRIDAAFDKDQVPVKSLTDTLLARQKAAADAFARGGEVSVVRATEAFYAKTDVVASVTAAKQAFAESIWRYVEMIGKATAVPFYQFYQEQP